MNHTQLNTQKKIFLYMALAFVSMLLIDRWNLQHTIKNKALPVAPVAQHEVSTVPQDPIIPPARLNHSQLSYLNNSKLSIGINQSTGEIIDAKLIKFHQTKQNKQPMQLFATEANHFYFAESGLIDTKQSIRPISYSIQAQTPREVTLQGNLGSLHVTKTICLQKNRYIAHVRYSVTNHGMSVWQGQFYQQLTQKLKSKASRGLFQSISTYEGMAISNPNGKHYQKIPFKNFQKTNLSETITGGWLAMQQHYFLSAWILSNTTPHHYYGHYLGDDIYTIGASSAPIKLLPQQTQFYESSIYIGPELLDELRAAAPALDLTVDFGWLWWFAQPILLLLVFLNNYLNNWGWSIIAVTFLIKLLFYRLSAKSYHSMANMRQLQPKLEMLKARYGDDKEKFGRETMALYQAEKVNPFSGCLPMLVQIPVFISLYYVLLESVQLRHTGFILWITDLSVPDPYYILPYFDGAGDVDTTKNESPST